jgi:outer membrane protein
MTIRIRTIALCGLLVATPGIWADDLIDVYQLALQNDPIIREALANRDAAMEARPLAWASLLPQVNASASYSDTTSQSLGSSLAFDPDNNFALVLLRTPGDTDSEASSFTFSVDQTLFDWGLFQTLKQADSQVAQAEADYQAAIQSLMSRTLGSYFSVLSAQDELQALEDNLNALDRQLEQTQRRFEVGLIAITDVQESKAARDNAYAAVIAQQRTLATSRENLRELTNFYHVSLARPIDDLPLTPPAPMDPEAWVRRANERNLTLQSARLAAEATRRGMESSRGRLYPTLSLRASRTQFDNDFTNNLFFNQFTGQFEAIGFPSVGSNETISLQFNAPIWNGGRNYSNLRRQAALHSASLERAVAVQRQTERQARDAYLGVISEISRVRALRQASESSRTALAATQAGFEVGTRTTVDVLTSQQALTRAQTNYYRSRYDYIRQVVALKLAAGSLSADDLVEINGWLVETGG